MSETSQLASKSKRKLIIVTIDGVRSDALNTLPLLAINKIRKQGVFSAAGQTIYPCSTLPAHTALFTGLEPAAHGIYDNETYPQRMATPTLFDRAHDAGYKTGAYISWFPLANIYGDREKLNDCYYHKFYSRYNFKPHAAFYPKYVQHVLGFSAYLAKRQLELVHFYLEAPDVWGHYSGWMSDDYLHALAMSDRLLARVLTAVRRLPGYEDVAVLVTTDHGGSGDGHTEDTVTNRTTWFAAAGAGICVGKTLAKFHITDFVPTFAYYLGLAYNPRWRGNVLDIFTS